MASEMPQTIATNILGSESDCRNYNEDLLQPIVFSS
jgi:hypothetical protein